MISHFDTQPTSALVQVQAAPQVDLLPDISDMSSSSSSAVVISDVLVESSRFTEFNNSFKNQSKVVNDLKTFPNDSYVENGTKSFYGFSGNITSDVLVRRVQKKQGTDKITVLDLGGGEGEVSKRLNEMGCKAFSISLCHKKAYYNICADLHDLNSALDARLDIAKPNLVISKFTFNFLKDPLKVLQDIYNRSAPGATLLLDNITLFGLSPEDGGWALFSYLRNQGYIINAIYNNLYNETDKYCLYNICIYIEKTHSNLILPIDRVGIVKVDQSVKKPLCIETYFYKPKEELKRFYIETKSSISNKEATTRKALAALIPSGPDKMMFMVEKIIPWGKEVLNFYTEIEQGRFNHITQEEAKTEIETMLIDIADSFEGENKVKAQDIIQNTINDLLNRIQFMCLGDSGNPATAATEVARESKVATRENILEPKIMSKVAPAAHAIARSMHEFFKADPVTLTSASHSSGSLSLAKKLNKLQI